MSQNVESPTKEPTDIFINYRRADASGHAGRLAKDLSQQFPDRVFMDIHAIEVGANYSDAINNQLARCCALIVLIGNQWLNITDPKTGKRRLDNPKDLVVLEIAEALKRNLRVIPVLVEGTSMPQSEELPASLAALSELNAMEISDTRWDYDVAQLVKVLGKICGTTIDEPGGGAPATSPLLKFGLPIAAALIAVVALVIYLLPGSTPNGGHPSPSPAPSASPAPPTQTPTPLVRGESRPKAVVHLSKRPEPEAEFFFPFDPAGDWQWNLKQSKADEEEYTWDVVVEGKPGGPGFYATLYWQKPKKSMPRTGNFKSLLRNLSHGVQLKKAGEEKYGDLIPKFVDFVPEVQPDGLKLTLRGKNVETMFAHRPKEVTLWTLLAKRKPLTEAVVDVEYSRR